MIAEEPCLTILLINYGEGKVTVQPGYKHRPLFKEEPTDKLRITNPFGSPRDLTELMSAINKSREKNRRKNTGKRQGEREYPRIRRPDGKENQAGRVYDWQKMNPLSFKRVWAYKFRQTAIQQQLPLQGTTMTKPTTVY
jgi:hypothetical protein